MTRTCRALIALACLPLVAAPALADEGVRFASDYDAALRSAAATGRPLFVKFSADW